VNQLEQYDTGSFVDFSWLPITETPVWPNTVGLLQLLLLSTSHACRQLTSRDLTFAPLHTRPSFENKCRVRLPPARVSYGACVWEGGKCPVPAPTMDDRTEPIFTPAT